MRTALMGLLMAIVTTASAQTPNEKAAPIVAEGKRLYRSEMASWYGTDLFLEAFKDRDRIGGYFSYVEGSQATCVFYSRDEHPKVIGTMRFDSTYDVARTRPDLTERDFTATENAYYELRTAAREVMQADTFFQRYANTSLNSVPLITTEERKVYVLTATTKSGVVLLGNDYLLTFDGNNRLVAKKKLHQNLIPIGTNPTSEDGTKVVGTVHNHLPATGDYITATDICTLMLYARMVRWETHTVVSEKYLNLWNLKSNVLTVIPRPEDADGK